MFLTFGEVMMRITPEGAWRFRQSLPGAAEITFGGGEANVAVSLALFGARVRYMTALPRNAMTDSLLALLRGFGIETGHVLLRDTGRLGIYFLETGANQRASNVIYDRDGSAIALAEPDEYDFEGALMDTRHVHVTGITPALSENAFRSTLRLVEMAKQKGATVSCDMNFRKKLWRWRSGAQPAKLAGECMSQILKHADLIIGNEEDAADVLGIKAEGASVEEGRLNAAAYEFVARSVVKLFPGASRVAITLRGSVSADYNQWGAMLFDAARNQAFFAPTDAQGAYAPYEIRDIVDRVGGGDAFAAALLYALGTEEYREPHAALRFAVAASCLKHSVKGDFNYVTRDEVVGLLKGGGSGRVKR